MPIMPAISDAEMASIRADVAATLNLDCTIQRKPSATDIYGSPGSGTYATISTCKAGMKQPGATLLTNYAYLIGSLSTWQVSLPFGTDVKRQDMLLIGNDKLEVQVVLDPRSYAASVMLLASEVK
jgi:hypothetical protein